MLRFLQRSSSFCISSRHGGRIRRFAALAFFVAGGAAHAFAALRWDSTVIKLNATSGDPSVVAVYHFRNAGPQPVTIMNARTSCGCTHAEFSPGAIPVGGEGFVKATFDVGDRVGQQRKFIDVFTDGGAKPVMLTLEVDIAELVTCDPHIVRWDLGETATEKTFEFHAVGNGVIERLDAPVSPVGVALRLEVVETGKAYRLHVTPTDTSKVGVIPVDCTVQVEGHPAVHVHLFAVIR